MSKTCEHATNGHNNLCIVKSSPAEDAALWESVLLSISRGSCGVFLLVSGGPRVKYSAVCSKGNQLCSIRISKLIYEA